MAARAQKRPKIGDFTNINDSNFRKCFNFMIKAVLVIINIPIEWNNLCRLPSDPLDPAGGAFEKNQWDRKLRQYCYFQCFHAKTFRSTP